MWAHVNTHYLFCMHFKSRCPSIKHSIRPSNSGWYLPVGYYRLLSRIPEVLHKRKVNDINSLHLRSSCFVSGKLLLKFPEQRNKQADHVAQHCLASCKQTSHTAQITLRFLTCPLSRSSQALEALSSSFCLSCATHPLTSMGCFITPEWWSFHWCFQILGHDTKSQSLCNSKMLY